MKIPQSPSTISAASLEDFKRFMEIIVAGFTATQEGRYRHWDTLRHIPPPEGFTSEEWWTGIKSARTTLMRQVPLYAKDGLPFTYATVDVLYEMLHTIDKQGTGSIRGNGQTATPHIRDTYIMRTLMEEAITSSQLEGASTTHKVAKEMIESGRQPLNKSERMIYNNYQAMQFIRGIKDEKLTPAIVLELHRLVTDGTLDRPEAAGRLRRMDDPDDAVTVVDERDQPLHIPPSADQLPQRMEAMCAFANDAHSSPYMHPVVRSIILHFWLAYDHPFVDGNGRTARALFYWSMSHWDYWLCEFISISRILKQAQGKYARSFLYTETDNNDLTYFILAQLKVIIRAIDDLHLYLARKAQERENMQHELARLPSLHASLNHRQLDLINHALKHPGHSYTIASHRNSHVVSYLTARSDLQNLAARNLLEEKKIGKTLHYVVPSNLRERLQSASSK